MVQTIAQQCPYAGGPAVFRAWTFVGLLNETIEYDDNALCQHPIGNRMSQLIPNFSRNDIEIIPNPANEKIEVILSNSAKEICEIKIYELENSLVLSKTANCKEKIHYLSTVSVKPGAYLVKISGEYLKMMQKPFVIIR